MSKSYYFKDQNVFAEDLNNTENSRIEDVKNRIQALLGNSGGIYNNFYSEFSVVKGGIFGRPDEYVENKNLKVGLSDTSTLFIYPGDAIDVDGNHIKVETTKTVELGNEDSNYKWTPTTGTNYIKIKYSQSSGSVGTDDLGNQYYARYYDSYYVEIDGTHPSGSTGNPILLGVFTGLGDGSVSLGTLSDRRSYAKVITTADGVIIDPFRNPVASQITAADHIAATGSGTPSLKNIHGLSFEDIGGEDFGLHRIQSHINGIIPYDRQTATLNSFKGNVVNNNTPSAAISFTAPSNAVLSVGGRIISTTLPSLTGASAFALNGNGNYVAFADKNGNTLWVTALTAYNDYFDAILSSTGINPYYTTGHKNSDYYYLGLCTVSAGGNTLSFTDRRSFLTTHLKDIIADFKESTAPPSSPLSLTASLEDTLNRIRHQIGIAITGNSNDWNSATSPLTSGLNADSLHTHSLNHLDDIGGTDINVFNLDTLTAGPSSNADHLHTHSLSLANASVLVIDNDNPPVMPEDEFISLPWQLKTGDPYYGFDNLNLLQGAPSMSVINLAPGTYKINSSVVLLPFTGSGLSALYLSSQLYASDSLSIITEARKYYGDTAAVQRSSIELETTLEISSEQSFYLRYSMSNDVNATGSIFRGRLSVLKIGAVS